MTNIKSKFIQIDSYNIHYLQAGTSNKNLILLHGFALSCDIWLQNIDKLSQNYTVIALDIIGFGKSDVPKKEISVDFLPQFIFHFLNKLNIAKATFIGHSMGGMISLWIAINYPKIVESLILVGSAGFKTNIPFHFRLFSLPIFGELMVKPNKRGLKHALKRSAYKKQVISNELVHSLYTAFKKPGRGQFYLHTCRNAISFYGFKYKIIRMIQKECIHIKIPVQLIWGKEDKIISVSHAYRAKKLLPQAQLEIFEQCGHLPQMEEPEKFNYLVFNFLESKCATLA